MPLQKEEVKVSLAKNQADIVNIEFIEPGLTV